MSEPENKQDTGGQGGRLALMRLYDELDDAGKQELLRFAVTLRRQKPDGGTA